MNRTVDWADWRVRRATMACQAARLSQQLSLIRRGGEGGRERTPAESAMITRMVHIEVERRIAEGRLVRLGPREYELRLRTAAPPRA